MSRRIAGSLSVLVVLGGASHSTGSGVAASSTNSIGMRLVAIEPGTFSMGALNPTPGGLDPNPSERVRDFPFLAEGDWDERPVHEVTIRQPFRISETEVTLEQYRKFRPKFSGGGPHAPYVTGVSWEDATAFCRWLSKKEGRPYRLPTEAEWEYAARAGTRTLFWSGARPPAADSANLWGLKNVHSGPIEWTQDWYGEYPYEPQTDPVGPETGQVKVVRGGSVQALTEPEFASLAAYYARAANRGGLPPGYPPDFSASTADSSTQRRTVLEQAPLGFRVVQAPLPATAPWPVEAPFVQQSVRQSTTGVPQGPDPKKPYFKLRPILPIPPENDQNDLNDEVGLHPALLAHNHCPGIAVLPNGDVLAVFFASTTASTEYHPNVGFVATRLRYGSEQWDMPDWFLDFPDVNDQSALVWNDAGRLWFFGGGRFLPGVPFKWMTSTDNGATWSPIRFPIFDGPIGPHTEQPINSIFRDAQRTLYIPSDGEGGTSLLWASRDDGASWFDTGGRTFGRHTTFALLKDGGFLGMGGKNTDQDTRLMPKGVSRDSGRTWQKQMTEFPWLDGNQRPSLIRLASGRLFFATDYQHHRGLVPKSLAKRGSLVALSDDEGETWHVRRLTAATQHESQVVDIRRPWSQARHKGGTIGYSVAAQAPSGLIHLVSTMNHPSLHFEMNEAWILAGDDAAAATPDLEATWAIRDVREHRETYPSGALRARWSAGTDPDGRYLLHGTQQWLYEDGTPQWSVSYQYGRKVGEESYWSRDGRKRWNWAHRSDGSGVWTRWWPNGRRRSESTWRDFKCVGVARTWAASGALVSEIELTEGVLAEIPPEP